MTEIQQDVEEGLMFESRWKVVLMRVGIGVGPGFVNRERH